MGSCSARSASPRHQTTDPRAYGAPRQAGGQPRRHALRTLRWTLTFQPMLGVQIDPMRRSWRSGETPSLRRRRTIAALCAAGAVDFSLISLFQLGVVRHLPDPPGKIFDSDRVNSSRKASAYGLPDGPLGLLQYALTLGTLAFGGTRDTGRPAAATWALATLVGAGAVGALDYLRDMLFREKRVCPYCVAGAALNLAMVPLAWCEVRDAWRAR